LSPPDNHGLRCDMTGDGRGKQRASPLLIESIARFTDGAVPPNSFFNVTDAAAAE